MPTSEIPSQKFIKGEDGRVYRVSDEQVVSREDLVNTAEKAAQLLAISQENLANFDSVSNPPEQTPVEQAQEIAEDAAELADDLADEHAAVPEESSEPAPGADLVAPVAEEAPVAPAPSPSPTPSTPEPAPSDAPVPQPPEIQ